MPTEAEFIRSKLNSCEIIYLLLMIDFENSALNIFGNTFFQD